MHFLNGNEIIRTLSSFLNEQWLNLRQKSDPSQIEELLDQEFIQFKKETLNTSVLNLEDRNFSKILLPELSTKCSSVYPNSVSSENGSSKTRHNFILPFATKEDLTDFYTEIIINKKRNQSCSSCYISKGDKQVFLHKTGGADKDTTLKPNDTTLKHNDTAIKPLDNFERKPSSEHFIQNEVQSEVDTKDFEQPPPTNAAIQQYLQPVHNKRKREMQNFTRYNFPPCSLFGQAESRIKFDSQGEIITATVKKSIPAVQGYTNKPYYRKEAEINTDSKPNGVDVSPQTSLAQIPLKQQNPCACCKEIFNSLVNAEQRQPQNIKETKLMDPDDWRLEAGDIIHKPIDTIMEPKNTAFVLENSNFNSSNNICVPKYFQKIVKNQTLSDYFDYSACRSGHDCTCYPLTNTKTAMEKGIIQEGGKVCVQQYENKPKKRICFPRNFKNKFKGKKISEYEVSSCSGGGNCKCKPYNALNAMETGYIHPDESMCVQRENGCIVQEQRKVMKQTEKDKKKTDKEVQKMIKDEEKRRKKAEKEKEVEMKWRKRSFRGNKNANFYQTEDILETRIPKANKYSSNSSLCPRSQFGKCLVVGDKNCDTNCDVFTQKVQTSHVTTADTNVQVLPSPTTNKSLPSNARCLCRERNLQTSGVLTMDSMAQSNRPNMFERSVQAESEQNFSSDTTHRHGCGCTRNTIVIPPQAYGVSTGELETLKMLLKMQAKDNREQFKDLLYEIKNQKNDIQKLYEMYQNVMANVQSPKPREDLKNNHQLSKGNSTDPSPHVSTGISTDPSTHLSKGIYSDENNIASPDAEFSGEIEIVTCTGSDLDGVDFCLCEMMKQKNEKKTEKLSSNRSEKEKKNNLNQTRQLSSKSLPKDKKKDDKIGETVIDNDVKTKNLHKGDEKDEENVSDKNVEMIYRKKEPTKSVTIKESSTKSSHKSKSNTSQSEKPKTSEKSWTSSVYQWVKSSIENSQCREKYNRCKANAKETLFDRSCK